MATVTDDRQETASLIGSDKVEGTVVYGADDQKIGSFQIEVRFQAIKRTCPHVTQSGLLKLFPHSSIPGYLAR